MSIVDSAWRVSTKVSMKRLASFSEGVQVDVSGSIHAYMLIIHSTAEALGRQQVSVQTSSTRLVGAPPTMRIPGVYAIVLHALSSN